MSLSDLPHAATDTAPDASLGGLELEPCGAESAASSPPPLRIGEGDEMLSPIGPFMVISREFRSANQKLFDDYAEAHTHALWLARSTPGFTYMICAPIGFVCADGPKGEGE